MHTDKFEDAIEFFRKLTDDDASDGIAWLKLAVAYVGFGKLEKGLNSAEEALERRPQDLEALNLVGSISSILGKDEQAIDYLDRAIEINPEHTRAWISKITTLRKLDRVNEAKDCYRRGTKKAPQLRDPEDWNDLAGISYERGELQETVDFLNFMQELEPDEFSYKFNKLGPLSKMKRYQDVIDLAEEIVKENPDFVPGRVVKGISLLALHRYQEALENFDMALKLEPSNLDVLDLKQKTLKIIENSKYSV